MFIWISSWCDFKILDIYTNYYDVDLKPIMLNPHHVEVYQQDEIKNYINYNYIHCCKKF